MTFDSAPDSEDPMHMHARDPDVRWTIANVGEALIGVHPPLTVTYAMDGAEISGLMMWRDNGVVSADEVRLDNDPDQRMTAVFFGRFCLNLKKTADIVTRLPGVDVERMEEGLTGEAKAGASAAEKQPRPGLKDIPAYARLLVVGASATPRLRRRLQALEPWWRNAVGGRRELGAAQRLFRESYDKYVDVLRFGLHASMLGPRIFSEVVNLAEAKGMTGLENELFTGLGMPEEKVAEDLWEASRGRLPVSAIIDRHGYQAPRQFDFIADSWRTRADIIDPLIEALARVPEDQNPHAKHVTQVAARQRAEQRLRAASNYVERIKLRVMLPLAAHFLRQREAQKVGCLMALDGARAASREIAGHLVAQGSLSDPSDIAFLTLAEACSDGLPSDIKDLVGSRRAKYEQYLTLDLPESWVGPPVPISNAESTERASADRVSGFPVTPGVVEGRAVVVTDPDDAFDVEPGDILVCRSTDPSWTPVMMIAGALVIDVGGPMSHGAIVARELGVPCVTNTKSGTRQIQTGNRVRVDGTSGEVTVIGASHHEVPIPAQQEDEA
ncbi:PEP-utilizing enzyme [Mycobacterium sp. CVI_P3]|uniref:PEP-utilizing enzyme n=1 Tax=Mycobacterium pinniadriaticum TaxID=2994102 RepID=A0ABT3SN17_9MYCO|nr:PEP-utilizing enzyme [Mycobacterium pinniadriaticum]MCX2934314.1 PEP-utilizing enzyme [Mycobacterium pinniadriaticum]MCX2940737.1 PEP-utilizing enzyme [Mycobacterium pinniadriaticum]